MKYIPLTKGKTAVVDNQDYEMLMQWSWYFGEDGNGRGYARRTISEGRVKHKVRMHHQIMGKPPFGFVCDHINGDTLDNRRCNLRFCTPKQNLRNRGVWRNKQSCRFKGVRWNSRLGNWYVRIYKDGRQYHVGTFNCPIKAAQAYNERAKLLFGEFARLNVVD